MKNLKIYFYALMCILLTQYSAFIAYTSGITILTVLIGSMGGCFMGLIIIKATEKTAQKD